MMSRYRASFRATGVGTNLLPQASLYAIAAVRLELREVWVFNTTAVAVNIALVRLSTAATQGAGVTEIEHDPDGPPPLGTVFQAHSSAGPTITDEIARAPLAAAIGAGAVWTFDDEPIRIAPGTANGAGIIIPTGTGQICDIIFVWDE